MEIVEVTRVASAKAGHVVGGGETTREGLPDKPYSAFFSILSKSFIFQEFTRRSPNLVVIDDQVFFMKEGRSSAHPKSFMANEPDLGFQPASGGRLEAVRSRHLFDPNCPPRKQSPIISVSRRPNHSQGALFTNSRKA